MKTKICALLVLLLLPALARPALAADQGADAILGVWATEKDENGQAHVKISKSDDGIYNGEIIWLEKPTYPPDDPQGMGGQKRVDRNNPDAARHEDPILGLAMLRGFRYDGDNLWTGGTIYDPNNGKTYKSKMRLGDDGVLHVRGYIGFSLLGRTTEWTRVEE